jgi:prepilin-type N-terminal cleavage/methylation domain-containing protein
MLSVRRSVSRRAVRCRGEAAFTLVELLTVIAVVAILAGLAFGMIRGAMQRAATQRAKSELATLVQALEDYRRHYGDYPETGPSAANAQKITALVGQTQVPALLFNSLIGVYGPTGVAGGRINGPVFVDLARLTLEVPLTAATLTTVAVPTGSPPAKTAVANSFVDPWGNRYLYFYKRTATAAWTPPGYVLYSSGPDGASTILPNATGIFTGTTQTTGDNADNLYASKLQ